MASNVQTPPLADQTRHMVAQTKTLLNEQLRRVLKEEELAVSGVKAELQLRIINRTRPRATHSDPPPLTALWYTDIYELQNAGDISGMNRLRTSLYYPRHGYSSYSPSASTNTPPSSLSPQYPQPIRQTYQPNYSMPPQSPHGSMKDPSISSLNNVLTKQSRSHNVQGFSILHSPQILNIGG